MSKPAKIPLIYQVDNLLEKRGKKERRHRLMQEKETA
jgi:hypothetical protein